jgi:hypothetical protein
MVLAGERTLSGSPFRDVILPDLDDVQDFAFVVSEKALLAGLQFVERYLPEFHRRRPLRSMFPSSG